MPAPLEDVDDRAARKPTVTVRAAHAADEPFVRGLATRFGDTRAVWRSFAEVVSGTERALGAAFREPRADETLLIADHADGSPAGFAYVVTQTDFFTGEPHGHLSEIASARDGGGAGRALLAACEAWSRERGHRYLSLNVNDANERAHAFYARHAFEPEYRHLVKRLR